MEDYKEKYEEALEKARGLYEQGMMPERIEYIFPELKEIEEEKIRKEIIENLKLDLEEILCKVSGDYDERDADDKERQGYLQKAISWLEKQGEQNTNEIHPIFRVGDYIKNKKTSDKVLIEQLDIATKAYCYVSYDGGAEIHSDFSFSKQDEWMLIGQNIVEQKNAWSKEDERMFTLCASSVKTRYNDGLLTYNEYEQASLWLKSLKDRMKGE